MACATQTLKSFGWILNHLQAHELEPTCRLEYLGLILDTPSSSQSVFVPQVKLYTPVKESTDFSLLKVMELIVSSFEAMLFYSFQSLQIDALDTNIWEL